MRDRRDEHSFEDFMSDVKPLKESDQVHFNQPHKSTLAQTLRRQSLNDSSIEEFNYLITENASPVAPDDMLEYKQPGIQDGVYKKLRLGKYDIDKSVTIQQLPFEKARQLTFDTIIKSYNQGSRVLLIKHGMGVESKPFPAFIKSYLNHWLQQLPEVIAFHSAQKRHGGLTSVYVLLKKNRQEKLANRELHRRRG